MPPPTPSELLIRQRLAALSRSLPRAAKGNVTAVHHARVATRRLAEALALVTSGSAARRLGKVVRRVRRALGPVRELDVVLMMLDEYEAAGEVPRPAIACLRQAVVDERQRVFSSMLRSLDRSDLDKFRRKALSVARAEGPPRPARALVRDPRVRGAAVQRAAARAERLQTAVENAGGIYLPDRLHEVRIAIKKLRYAVELLGEVGGRRGQAARIALLKRAQNLLGRMHDLEVLIARTRAVQGSARAPNLELSAGLDHLVRRAENECRQLHGQYTASRRTLLAACDHIVARAAEARPPASAA